MTEYKKYINALRKCAKEHDNDVTFTGHIIVSDLCRDTANLLEELEQQPCDDAISREAAITIAGTHTLTVDETVKALERLPSVTQKSGKWIKVKSGDKDFPESIVCSRCSNENSHLDFNENAEPIGKVFVTSKYCPNCGAKMVESQESEDKG